MENLNLGIIQQGTLANITVESTILSQIVAAQKENKGIAHIGERVVTGKAPCFWIDDEAILLFKNRLVVPKVPELRFSRSSMKLTCPDSLYIQEATRCIKI